MKLYHIGERELSRIRESERVLSNPYLFSGIAANIARLNSLFLIKRSSSPEDTVDLCDSAVDIMTWLYTQILKNPNESVHEEICDTFFYCGAHFVPSFCALQVFLGKTNPMHSISSLKLAIFKAREVAHAKRQNNAVGRIYLLIDGEKLQCDQSLKLLCRMAEENLSEVTIIADNPLASEKIAYEFYDCGWETAECNGHNFKTIDKTLRNLRDKNSKRKPQALVLYTTNSKEKKYEKILEEFKVRVDSMARLAGLGNIVLESVEI